MKRLLWHQILMLNLIKAYSTSNELSDSKQQCIGKHQIPFKGFNDYELHKKLEDPIKIKNFYAVPIETTLENNDQTIVINMKYKNIGQVPTINFGASVDLGTYRFEFLYYQWYASSVTTTTRTTWTATPPFELHAVFYSVKFKEFQEVLHRKNMIVVLAFNFELKNTPVATSKLQILNKNLKSVRAGANKTAIENCPLSIWLPSLMQAYLMYEGYFPFRDCSALVLWVDFESHIPIEPEVIKEFELLKTSSGRPLIKPFRVFVPPNRPLVAFSPKEDKSFQAIPLVDGNDDDGEYLSFAGAVYTAGNCKKLFTLIICLAFYFIFL